MTVICIVNYYLLLKEGERLDYWNRLYDDRGRLLMMKLLWVMTWIFLMTNVLYWWWLSVFCVWWYCDILCYSYSEMWKWQKKHWYWYTIIIVLLIEGLVVRSPTKITLMIQAALKVLMALLMLWPWRRDMQAIRYCISNNDISDDRVFNQWWRLENSCEMWYEKLN